MLKWGQYLMRIGVAGTFIGHGLFAVRVEPSWISYLTTVGFEYETAIELMPLIGYMDLVIAIFAILLPMRIILIWATIWAFSTALVRPIAGLPILAFVERAANWILPLSLLIVQGLPKHWYELFLVHGRRKQAKRKQPIIQNS